MCEAIRGMIEDGRLEGRREGRKIIARNLYLRGMSCEDTAAICEEDIEQVKSWYEQWEK